MKQPSRIWINQSKPKHSRSWFPVQIIVNSYCRYVSFTDWPSPEDDANTSPRSVLVTHMEHFALFGFIHGSCRRDSRGGHRLALQPWDLRAGNGHGSGAHARWSWHRSRTPLRDLSSHVWRIFRRWLALNSLSSTWHPSSDWSYVLCRCGGGGPTGDVLPVTSGHRCGGPCTWHAPIPYIHTTVLQHWKTVK